MISRAGLSSRKRGLKGRGSLTILAARRHSLITERGGILISGVCSSQTPVADPPLIAARYPLYVQARFQSKNSGRPAFDAVPAIGSTTSLLCKSTRFASAFARGGEFSILWAIFFPPMNWNFVSFRFEKYQRERLSRNIDRAIFIKKKKILIFWNREFFEWNLDGFNKISSRLVTIFPHPTMDIHPWFRLDSFDRSRQKLSVYRSHMDGFEMKRCNIKTSKTNFLKIGSNRLEHIWELASTSASLILVSLKV